MEIAGIELESDDGEYEDGEEDEQSDLQQRRHRAEDRLEHHLETYQFAQKHPYFLCRNLECENTRREHILMADESRSSGSSARASKIIDAIGE